MARLSLSESTVHDLAEALRDRRLSAETLIEEAEDRHRRYGEVLNAYKHWNRDGAVAQARAADAAFDIGAEVGPLQGLPVSIKDVFGIRGLPTYAGTAKRLPEKYEAEGAIVAALRRQLSCFVGKTHTVPFAFGVVGANAHWGAPRNPWDAKHHRMCGGSSSGAGGSVHEGSALISLGSDAGGSIRVPASLTGTAAIKTSMGRWLGSGAPPLCPTQDTPGIFARTVADLIVGFAAIDPAGHRSADLVRKAEDRPLRGLRIAVGDDLFFGECGSGIAEAVRSALRDLESQGAVLADLAIPETVEAREFAFTGSTSVPEGLALVETEFADWLPTLDANVVARLTTFGRISAQEYLARRRRLKSLGDRGNARLEGFDVLVVPTTALTAPRLDEVADVDAHRRINLMLGRNAMVFNILDFCAVNLPVALDPAGLPIGMQVLTRRFEEEKLLAAAHAIERTLGTTLQRLGRPPLCP